MVSVSERPGDRETGVSVKQTGGGGSMSRRSLQRFCSDATTTKPPKTGLAGNPASSAPGARVTQSGQVRTGLAQVWVRSG